MALRAESCPYAYEHEHEISTDPQFGGLMCPHCQSEYMHQVEARVLWRGEDGDGTCHTSSYTKEAKETVRSEDIPGRRDFMEIDFDCEVCSERPTLYIQQHKGQTYMGWVK